MTSLVKIEANRQNALKSNGPRTEEGKAVAKHNAVSHGLRSPSPVVPGEDPADWAAYRGGVAAALAPAGTLEEELADRVASLSWQLRRVTAYETGVTAAACERAVLKVHFPDELPDPDGR